MRHRAYIWIWLMAALATCLTSCSETDDTIDEFPDWQKKNETYFTAKYNAVKSAVSSGDTSWKIFKSYARDDNASSPYDHILVKVLRQGTGSGSPLFTDSVRVHYRGQLLASTTHIDNSDHELGLVFDKSWSTDEFNERISVPSKFAVSSLVDGFSTALQHMCIGDRWLVYIPYQLGYGTTGSSSIPGYSTLVFDIALAAYYRPGTAVPQWSSNEVFLWEENF